MLLLVVLWLPPSASSLLWLCSLDGSVPRLHFPSPFDFLYGEVDVNEATVDLQLGAWHLLGPRNSNRGRGWENDNPDTGSGVGEQGKLQVSGMGMGCHSPAEMSPLSS